MIRHSRRGSTATSIPIDPRQHGVGESANQFSVPVIGPHGAVNIAYVLEECNSSLDHGLRLQRSTDGGATFLATPVHVNKGTSWVDSPDAADLLPGTVFSCTEHNRGRR